MTSRYDDRDYDRETQNYGRRGESDYRSSYRDRSSGRYRYDDSERETERYGRESDLGGEYSSRYSPSLRRESRSRESNLGGEYSGRSSPTFGRGSQSRREYSGSRWEDDDYSSEQRSYPRDDYSSERGEYSERLYGRSYSDEGRYGDRSTGYSQRYNYPTGFRSGERYGERERSSYETTPYRGERDYGYERDYGSEPRGWWDRASDEVASWFGDEQAERRRQLDQQREQFRGRGPKGYRRSDERIKEDVNDRLSEGFLDASDIEVAVLNSEVTLTGTVAGRIDKRKAEAVAESVTGVTNVENRLRVKQSGIGRYEGMDATGLTGPMGTAGPTGTTGTTGTAGTSTSTAGATSRSKGAGN